MLLPRRQSIVLPCILMTDETKIKCNNELIIKEDVEKNRIEGAQYCVCVCARCSIIYILLLLLLSSSRVPGVINIHFVLRAARRQTKRTCVMRWILCL